MIQDVALRWVVTLLFVFSAGVCLRSIMANRGSGTNVIGNSLHAIMAIAMAVMAWPRGAELPTRVPMIFFVVSALWFAAATIRSDGHRVANVYHTLMMAAMAWMYAAMGGLPLREAGSSEDVAMAGTDMPDMPGMPGMPGMDAGSGHAGHPGHSGHAAGLPGTEPATWIAALNWWCTIGFTAAAVFWLYRFITARLQPSDDGSHHSVGILCQLAMATGMAIMFGAML